jgi:hypothetical protein
MATKVKSNKVTKKSLDTTVCGVSWVGLDICHDKELQKRPKQTLKRIKKTYGVDLEPALYRSVCIKWAMRGFGFGELTFWMEDGKLHCDNECMSRETVKKILCLMADQAVLRDDPKAKKS